MSEDRLISRIEVRNFKSVREASLDLRSLTVLVGENSAGKSSILQSLFLLAQASRSRTRPGIVALNGMELNLGNFRDVLHSSADARTIEIGLTIPMHGPGVRRRPMRFAAQDERDPQSLEGSDWARWALTLEDPREEMGVAAVSSIRLQDHASGVTLDISPNRDRERANEMLRRSLRIRPLRRPGVSRTRLTDDPFPETAFEGVIEVTRQAPEPEGRFPAVSVENGLPTELFGEEDESVILAHQWLRLALGRFAGAAAEWSSPYARHPRYAIAAEEEEQSAAAQVAEQFYPDFRRWVEKIDNMPEARRAGSVRRLDEARAWRAMNLGEALNRELAQLLRSEREQRWALAPRASFALDVSTAFSSVMSAIHYLGPLRAEPSPSYRPGQGGGVATLGMEGEYTVAVLHSNRYLRVPFLVNGKTKLTPLGEAVEHWAKRFDLASGIHTRDLGRPGVELEILDPQTDQPRDLTNVGVGVSQLLPVIVICLLAQPGELILLEQPELHLHPAPQQVLGEFLLDVAASGRQLIVETHSEYLINRLRRRVAEDLSGSSEELVRIWYATRTEGQTHFRAMDPDRFGSFEEWPPGFFDQAPTESEQLLRAVARKRRELT